MEHAPMLFSILFFVTFGVYIFFGIYIIHLNPRATLNKLFLLVCISLCFWSLGFSVANSAPNLETCLFWRRVSALGWASIYSILLHFFLVLTRNQFVIKHPWIITLIYAPAAIFVYAFSLSHRITASQFNFVQMDYGWVNLAVQNNWTLFFHLYYISYLLGCLLLAWLWKKSTSDSNIHKQAKIIFSALLASALLGTLTDVVLSSNLSNPLPQMAPIFNIITIGAIMYSIKRYNFMQEIKADNEDLILTGANRDKLYYYLAITFIAGGLLGLLSYFFPQLINSQESLHTAMRAGAFLLALGLVILLLKTLKNTKIKDFLILAATLSSIPVITLSFVTYNAVTIWAFPLILMIASLLYSTPMPLITVTVVAIIVQILVWVHVSVGKVPIDEFDYLLRIGILLIASWLGYVINRVYVHRIRENIYQTEFQKLISDISFSFTNVSQDNINDKITHLLHKTGLFFDVDRTYVFLIDRQDGTMTYTHEWCQESMQPRIGTIKNMHPDKLPWLQEQLLQKKLVQIENAELLPPQAKAEKDILAKGNTKSMLILPILENQELLGFIGLNSVVSFKKWSNYHVDLLKILANLLADGIIKIKSEKEIEFLAYYDQLTGIPNRILFADRLNQALHLAKHNGKFVGVVFIDLDSFKSVNDIMGHDAGDDIIRKVALGLVELLRETDTVARFGGDEFLILINNAENSKNIIKIVKKIMGIFEKPFYIKEQEFFIGCSAGVAVYPYDGEDTVTLIKNADIAMYKAKSSGKNRYALCTVDMKEEIKKNMILSNNLYRALERSELLVYYQPQIRVQTGQIIGLEALMRWQHPQMGMIPPNVFIPLAEQNGLINSMGEWVLQTAVTQNKRWQDMGLAHLRMAVNISVIQFSNPHFVDRVAEVLQKTDLDPQYLELEITESIATKEVGYTVDMLNKLKELGISISIDDFGTEYSSLNRLKILPIDRIKIDMQFVQGIERSEKDQAITKVIINLAQSLGLGVLAEGVETQLQLDFLNQKMCDDVQGYFYYKPMPAAEIEALLKSEAGV